MMSKLVRRFSTLRRNVWTKEKVVLCPFPDVQIPETTVHEYVFRNLEKWHDKTAVICGVSNRSYTYEEMYKHSTVFGANLRKKFKIKDGDVVAVLLPNIPEYPIALFGILMAGGVATTLNPVYTAYEIQRQIDSSGASLIITHSDLVANVKAALQLSRKDLKVISVSIDHSTTEGTISFKELATDNHVDVKILHEVKRKTDDIAFLPYSSGTTGLPKAVELSHANIVANCQQQNTEFRQFTDTTATNQDSTLGLLPIFHSYGLSIITLHKLSVGLKLVTLPRFQPDTFLKTLLNHKMNIMYLAPPLVLFLGSQPEATRKHLEHAKVVTCAAAPLPMSDARKFLDKSRPDVHFCQAYGMTEAGPLVTITPVGETRFMEVGYAIPNVQLRIVDSDLKNLGPGEIGELLIKGPNVMKGYKDNPKANSEVFVEDNWYRSGDIATINEKGLVTITDRLKELIKVKGYQVAPAELESIVKEHPDVFDVAVIGIPDANSGEAPKAFVVRKDNSRTTEKQIIEFVSEKVAPYKKIKEIAFVDSIPKNPSGKILRKVLKEQYS